MPAAPELEDGGSTSLVTILSSAHGKQRRSERLINKHNLQAAVKYGVKEEAWNQRNGVMQLRYKYTFAGVVFITDSESRAGAYTHSLTSELNLRTFGTHCSR
jgi:hypothetical protein